MTFEQLPKDWPTRSLSDPSLTPDVVDLCLKLSDRMQDSALLLLCDHEGRLLQPVVIEQVDWHAIADERAQLFHLFEHLEIPSVVVAVSSRKPINPGVVLRWLDTARRELSRVGVELLGFYCADMDEVWAPVESAA
ncbi:hypothetical protein [Aestuariimicrobium ganziense]|uniref:hypothetical protein n=1 Tax=Aestuariimicrobium ganziense TaxID=2773677 RepID=UPI001945664D|nr:hypothetical protein [Aestuariimicrobium ganziense]